MISEASQKRRRAKAAAAAAAVGAALKTPSLKIDLQELV
jgi:hypothetical protein